MICYFRRKKQSLSSQTRIKAALLLAKSRKTPTFALANKKWRFRLAARTHASHAWNTSSILVGATTSERF